MADPFARFSKNSAPQLGTAPRRKGPGVWVTRSGRNLTPDGAAYWERQFRSGHTDGQGHIGRPSLVQQQPRVVGPRPGQGPKLQQNVAVKKPGFDTFRKATQGDAQARQQVNAWIKHKSATVQQQAQAQQLESAQFAPVIPLAARANKTVNPAAGAVIKSLSPTEAAKSAYRSAQHGDVLGTALNAAAILPFGPGRGGLAVKGVKEALATRATARTAEGHTLEDVLKNMGAVRNPSTEHLVHPHPETGMPVRSKPKPYTLSPDPATTEPIHYAYRAISEDEWKYIQTHGYLKSDGRMNLAADEGTVAGLDNPSFYLPGKLASDKPGLYKGRIIKIRLLPEDGWKLHRDGYVKTPNAVPADRIEMVSPELHGVREERLTSSGKSSFPVLPDYQPVKSALTPEEQIAAAGKAAARPYQKQAALRTPERARRAEAGKAAYEEAGGGTAGIEAAKGQLKGELPRVRFDKAPNLDAATMDNLTRQVVDHPDLRFYEKLNLVTALGHLREGKVPTPSEAKLIERVFGTLALKDAQKASPFSSRLLHGVEEVWNAPRAIMSSFDVSAVLRQALLATVHKPGLAAKNIGPMFRMLFSQKNFEKTIAAIQADADYLPSKAAGVKYTDIGHDLPSHEEPFMSNWAEKITGLGPLVGKPVGTGSFVKMSNRAYSGFLNLMRLHLYKNLADTAHAVGVDLTSAKEQRDIGKIVNMMTGRGELPGKLEEPEVAALLNTFLFSPRLFASRFQALNPVFYAKLSPFARRQAQLAMLKLVGAGTSILGLAALAGAKVVADPRNADFGKIKVGNTRYDIWGGHQQLARFYAQLATGTIVSSTTGKKMHLTGGYGGKSRLTVIGRFFRGKENPSASLVHDFLAGTDYQGSPFSVKRELLARVWPLMLQDINDVYHQTGSPWQAGLGYGIGAWGVGVQSYGKQQPKQVGPDPFANLGGGSDFGGGSSGDPFSRFSK